MIRQPLIFPHVSNIAETRRALEAIKSISLSLQRWRIIDANHISRTPASTSTVTMNVDYTGIIGVGSPIQFIQNGTSYFALASAVTSSLLTIAGAPLLSGVNIDGLFIGQPTLAVQRSWFIPGAYGTGVADALSGTGNQYAQWEGPRAYLVSFAMKHKTNAGTTQPKMNVSIAGSAVSTKDSSNGIQPSTSWVTNDPVEISVANYQVDRGDAITIPCTVVEVAGGTSAANLSVSAIFVLE